MGTEQEIFDAALEDEDPPPVEQVAPEEPEPEPSASAAPEPPQDQPEAAADAALQRQTEPKQTEPKQTLPREALGLLKELQDERFVRQEAQKRAEESQRA